jgi:hypothetical protein
MSAYQLVARHVEAALSEAAGQSIDGDVVARCLLSEAVRIFKRNRTDQDIASELTGLADNLDDETPFVFMRP